MFMHAFLLFIPVSLSVYELLCAHSDWNDFEHFNDKDYVAEYVVCHVSVIGNMAAAVILIC